MKNKIISVIAICSIVLGLSTACGESDSKEKKTSPAVTSNQAVETTTAVTEAPKPERIRDFIYDASELSTAIDELGNDCKEFLMISGVLEQYNRFGTKEDEHIDKSNNNYVSEMIVKGADGTKLKCYLYYDESAKEYPSDLKNQIAYEMGIHYNIEDYVGKEIILAGAYFPDNRSLVFCAPVAEADVDSFYQKRMDEIKKMETEPVDVKDMQAEFLEDKYAFINKYYGKKFSVKGQLVSAGTTMQCDQATLCIKEGTREHVRCFVWDYEVYMDETDETEVKKGEVIINDVFFEANLSNEMYPWNLYERSLLKETTNLEAGN